MKVLVLEKISEEGLNLLKDKCQVDLKYNLDKAQIMDIIDQYDGVIIRSQSNIDKDIIEKGVNLKVIGRAGVGIDNIDVKEATLKGIIVTNTPEANIIAACEHTLALLLSSVRNISRANDSLKHNVWDRSEFKGVELYNKTVGVLGLGKIGSLVAKRLQSFDTKIIAYDPYVSDERFENLGIERKENVIDIMKEADFITIHLPKTKETLGIIGEGEFKEAKKGVRIVNCSRGGLIQEKALYDAIEAGIVASAALDVFELEPAINNPLCKLENVTVTPHIGALTEEAQKNTGITIAEQIINALEEKLVSNAVNIPSLPTRDMKDLLPFTRLAEKMGAMYMQLEKTPPVAVEIAYTGDISTKTVDLVTLSFIKGLLEPAVKDRINYVNARIIAKNRSIDIYESKHSKDAHFTNLISATVKGQNGKEYKIAGTLFGKEELRLVNLYDYNIDVTPSKYMLMVKNIDRPGMIGKIGNLMGQHDINIATMNVSRNKKGGFALMVLTVDNIVPKDLLQQITEVDGIEEVNFINLNGNGNEA